MLTVYSSRGCSACGTVKAWLEERRAAFREVLVEDDLEAALAMHEATGAMSVPVVVAPSGRHAVGFDEGALALLVGEGGGAARGG